MIAWLKSKKDKKLNSASKVAHVSVPRYRVNRNRGIVACLPSEFVESFCITASNLPAALEEVLSDLHRSGQNFRPHSKSENHALSKVYGDLIFLHTSLRLFPTLADFGWNRMGYRSLNQVAMRYSGQVTELNCSFLSEMLDKRSITKFVTSRLRFLELQNGRALALEKINNLPLSSATKLCLVEELPSLSRTSLAQFGWTNTAEPLRYVDLNFHTEKPLNYWQLVEVNESNDLLLR